MAEVVEGRVAARNRQILLGQFVDRADEMALFQKVLDGDDLALMVVTADTGMGKSALMMRMVHECSLRGLPRAEVSFDSQDVVDYMLVMRRLRDALGAAHFASFTELINQYTIGSERQQLDINVHLQGGTINVAGGAQISNSTVGDIAGVVVRDNMFVIQRPDLDVPIEMRRELLTQRFLEGMKALSANQKVVLFFNATEKMSPLTPPWLWGQLLKPMVDLIPNVRAVLLGQYAPTEGRELKPFTATAELKPLGLDDIDAYMAKRIPPAVAIDDKQRRAAAQMLAVISRGRPADVASNVDLWLTTLQPAPT